ncbi:protein of unknown function (plasmid) [Denitratisoma oestradiolicum]|uniref:Uncharacterized protein n=1 Tax=Denitratisoma oestradiolicum TaxID=311182 RepID=A0A6S6Y2I6_9PROT|nr:hypothetical protein [Denitratisoma oestradiolicum]CAB1371183.1 protein of unknown function [Denitratisoma oestradiolicum]
MVNAAQTLNTNTFAGETLPANKAGLQGISEKERKDLPNDIRAKHKRKAAATGAGSTAPVRTNTSTPGIVGQSRGAVEGQLDPKNKGSIPRGRAPWMTTCTPGLARTRRLEKGAPIHWCC